MKPLDKDEIEKYEVKSPPAWMRAHVSPRLMSHLKNHHAEAEASIAAMPSPKPKTKREFNATNNPQQQVRRATDLRAMFGTAPAPAPNGSLTLEQIRAQQALGFTVEEGRIDYVTEGALPREQIDIIESKLLADKNRKGININWAHKRPTLFNPQFDAA